MQPPIPSFFDQLVQDITHAGLEHIIKLTQNTRIHKMSAGGTFRQSPPNLQISATASIANKEVVMEFLHAC